ncbi:RNA helicase [Candidatus Poribacteria bacterium]|nr:MAG: RNA helicase [Candidatus Poribacteria bacterium]
MARLEDLQQNTIVKGILPNRHERVTVVGRNWRGDIAIDLFYKDSMGNFGTELLFRSREPDLEIVDAGPIWKFDGDGEMFRLVSEAYRIQLAHLFDPLLALHTSDVDPYPHQITAVYEQMLPRQPLRYLLADDPGAGKTIMTGLYLKELLVRGDLKRCMIVCPGSLVEQWQSELYRCFQLPFEILTRDRINNAVAGNIFQEENLLICRLDQLSRNEAIQEKLKETNWDIIVCDEAHKMSASFSGGEVRATKRYRLGQLLGKLTRHFLLLTATPHNGKEADFQLFMALLDEDRFEGRFRDGVHAVDTSDLMRRMVKEKLLKFDGKPLFPERYAKTINYELSELEKSLYDEVTEYVCKEMNRADLIKGQRGNRIGFALTILQRRLASSPEAIYCSIQRRRERLEERLSDVQLGNQEEMTGIPTNTEEADDFYDEAPAEEVETKEEEVVARASAAQTIAELHAEIQTLKRLEALAQKVRQSDTDRKWEELSNLLQDEELFDSQEHRRKLIIFTEHRDTLRYLTDRIQTLIGNPEAVVTIHGSMRWEERRKVQEDFRNNREVQILVATDAAGEGINLQQAHLMVNYDLPWNPNRIEQRFGRIHRIGQTEVCHLWNLVAAETREGEVFNTLLRKLEQQRDSLGGAVFDVLGKCFANMSLRDLLIEAIREGDRPEVKARLTETIDGALDLTHLQALIEENALTHGTMDTTRIGNIREEMERAEARRLQPHFIASFFREAFSRLQGRLSEREPGRYEIRHVPGGIYNRSSLGVGKPILQQYERITFEKDKVNIKEKPLTAEFVCPGHPLLDATLSAILERHRNLLKQGTILIDPNEQSNEVRVLFYLEHAIQDGRVGNDGNRHVVSRQMQFVEINSDKTVSTPGYAPYLDYDPIDEDERSAIEPVLQEEWLNTDLESEVKDYAVEYLVPEHLNEVKTHRETLVEKTMRAVKERLTKEINHWDNRVYALEQEAEVHQERAQTLEALANINKLFMELGIEDPADLKNFSADEIKEAIQKTVDDEPELHEEATKANAASLNAARARQRADELETRLKNRVEELQQELHISPMPPEVIGGALIIPQSLLDAASDPEHLASTVPSQTDRERIDRLAVNAVMEAERRLGREPTEMPHQNPGYDIESKDPNTNQLLFIEVKGKSTDATTVTVSKTQIFTAFNKPDSFILAIVKVDGDTAKEPRYIRQPFENEPDFSATSINYDLNKLLAQSETPS